jgi:hypothetical protein
MAKLNKTTMFKTPKPRSETSMDKTTRVVREIRDAETEQRQAKMSRLRKTRLEREAATSVDTIAKTPKDVRKKS